MIELIVIGGIGLVVGAVLGAAGAFLYVGSGYNP